MPLPAATRGRYPPQRQLSRAQYDAILDDTSIKKGIRLAVLRALEKSADAQGDFEYICDGEQLDGQPVSFSDSDQVGRAISKSNFERHLRSGWFGSNSIGVAATRDLMNDLEDPAIEPSDAGDIFRDTLSVGASAVSYSRTMVSWYYCDPDDPLDACSCVASDLAHRLALPDVFGSIVTPAVARPYYVLVALAANLDDPRRPRFTDSGQLQFLEVWRPGGKTAPWITHCHGLDEVVAPPLAFATHAIAVAFVNCHEP